MKNHLRKSPGNVPDGHQKIEPKTARTLLVIAAALLIIALAWRFFLEKNSFSGGIVRSLAQHGCNIEADELYKHNFAKNTSIRALVGDTDMTRAADASRECGFDADIDKTGDVYVLLANLGGNFADQRAKSTCNGMFFNSEDLIVFFQNLRNAFIAHTSTIVGSKPISCSFGRASREDCTIRPVQNTAIFDVPS